VSGDGAGAAPHPGQGTSGAAPQAGDTSAGVAPQAGVRNLANALTLLRLLLVPVFVVLLFEDGGHEPGWRIAAWAVFAAAVVTDRIDGEVARRRGLVTDVGKIADPIADKALTGAALVGLSLLGDLAWWITIVILARELAVTLLRFFVIRHGVIPASRGGKAKTLAQALAIGLYLLPLPAPLVPVAEVVMGIAVVLTVATGLDYLLRALRLRRTSERAAMKRRARAERVERPSPGNPR
jgi:CDP-diacylglycerol--glycerol-3-phosphate 3-phosphatidyltransferase